MTAILAALPTIYSLISMGVTGAQHLVTWVEGVRTAAQQSGEWTPEMEAGFTGALMALAKLPRWQPDAARNVIATPPVNG